MNDTSLAKFDPAEARIAALKADPTVADVLARLPALVEMEEADPIKEALRIIVPVRTEAGRVKDVLKREALDWGRAVDAKYNSILKGIAEVEKPLQDAKLAIESAEWRRAEERAAAAKAEDEAKRAAEWTRIEAERSALAKEREQLEAKKKSAEFIEVMRKADQMYSPPQRSASVANPLDEFAAHLVVFMRTYSPKLDGPTLQWFNENVRTPMLAIHTKCKEYK